MTVVLVRSPFPVTPFRGRRSFFDPPPLALVPAQVGLRRGLQPAGLWASSRECRARRVEAMVSEPRVMARLNLKTPIKALKLQSLGPLFLVEMLSTDRSLEVASFRSALRERRWSITHYHGLHGWLTVYADQGLTEQQL